MTEKIHVGSIVRITNGDGFQLKPDMTLFDPNDVELTVTSPAGVVIDLTADVLSISEGLYYADMTVTEEGIYWFRWNGGQVIEEGHFIVTRRRVAEPGS